MYSLQCGQTGSLLRRFMSRGVAEYWSEGRNVLGGFYHPLERGSARELEASLKEFSNAVDREVNQTYAMKLLEVLT